MQVGAYPKKLIEVALPIREISVESVRDKSLRHGHISTLHLWWARRPLAAARAVVIASLVPDPDDPNCPKNFCSLVELLLKEKVSPVLQYYKRGTRKIPDFDPYRPYEGLPDTLRNRLLMFIAKWSPESILFENGKSSKEPESKHLIDDRSLVKWETSDPGNPQGREVLRIARQLVHVAHDGKTPTVLDPFSGGGAIPLEALRLGCQAIANEYNPVAYLILRGGCEFPQKYGKPGKRKMMVQSLEKVEEERDVPNALAYDVDRWGNWILKKAEEKIGHLYPCGIGGQPVVAYLWARTAPCANPTCRGEIPLLRSLLVCNKSSKKVALTMEINKLAKKIAFGIAKGHDIHRTEGTMQKGGNVLCPFCEQVTAVENLRMAGLEGKMGERMVVVIVDTDDGKDYRSIEKTDMRTFDQGAAIEVERPSELILAEVTSSDVHVANRGQFTTHLYGMKTWGSLFNPRQLVAMQTFVNCLHEALEQMKTEIEDEEYRKAVAVYLGLWIGRVASRCSNVGIWNTIGEKLEHPFGRQAIPMIWDYPEANPFSDATGGAAGQLEWIVRVIEREGQSGQPAQVICKDAAVPFEKKTQVNAVVTDPPYFDAISYSDLSDYFYVWIKRAIGDLFPDVFATPLTPKSEEATALKHRHNGNGEKADFHFETKLLEALKRAKEILQPDGMITIMFAHQSTKAWSTLIRAILKAELNIDATWAIDTELTSALKANVSVLSSSVTVACRPRVAGGIASFKDIRSEIEKMVQESVKRFWGYGLRGADLIVACYGPAVGVFGKYERVEKADGTPVEIPELLELARKVARDAIAGEFRGDNVSTLYYVWANLYGISEQSWDDARLIVQIGGDAENAMEMARGHEIFVVNGSKCRLALLADRAEKKTLGVSADGPLIDALHHAILLWKEEKRSALVDYLSGHNLLEDGPFWKLAQALFEVLPRDLEDWKLVSALLGERSTLRTEGKQRQGISTGQEQLNFKGV